MKIFLICFLILFSERICFSQDKDSSNSKWSGSVTTTGLYQSGNTNKFLIQGKGDLKKEGELFETILLLSGSYGEYKGSKDDNTYYASLTADLFYRKTYSPFFLQYLEYNFAKGIELRSQSGAGLKYLFIADPAHKSSVSLALIYDYLDLVNKPGNSRSRELRFSFRLKTKQVLIDKRLELSFTGLYQPVVNYFSKANLFIDATVEVPLNKVFRVLAVYTYSFDNVVSVGRKRADNKLTFGAGVFF